MWDWDLYRTNWGAPLHGDYSDGRIGKRVNTWVSNIGARCRIGGRLLERRLKLPETLQRLLRPDRQGHRWKKGVALRAQVVEQQRASVWRSEFQRLMGKGVSKSLWVNTLQVYQLLHVRRSIYEDLAVADKSGTDVCLGWGSIFQLC